MQAVQLRLLINFLGQQIVEDISAASTETLGAVVRAVLVRDGLPLDGVRWIVRFQGRALRGDETIEQAFAGVPPGQFLLLDVVGEAATSAAPPPPMPFLSPPPAAARPVPMPPPNRPMPAAPGAGAAAPADEVFGSGYEVPVRSGARAPRPEEVAEPDESPVSIEAESWDLDEEPSDAEEAAAAPRSRAGTGRQVDRHATARYYSRMNPQRVYPLMVAISEKSVLEVIKAGVAQAVSKRFRVELGSDVEVEPILPGCTCYPARQVVQVGAGESAATFHVVPHVLGALPGGRVVVRQGGHVLAEVPLQAKVVKQTLAAVLGLATLILPAVRPLLHRANLDLETQLLARLGDPTGFVHDVLDFLTPLHLGLILAVLTLLAYLWLRPRRRDVFFDLTPATPEESLRLGLKAVGAGDEKAGVRMIAALTDTHPDYQPAWLFCGDWYYERGRFKDALPCYETALRLGKVEARTYLRAASAAARLGKEALGLALLKDAPKVHATSKSVGAIWYNMACYAGRLGAHDEARLYLDRAVKSGFRRAEQLHKERGPAPGSATSSV